MALNQTHALLALFAELLAGPQLTMQSREWLVKSLQEYYRQAGELSLDSALGLSAVGRRHVAKEARNLKSLLHLRAAAELIAVDPCISTWVRAGRLATGVNRMAPTFHRHRSSTELPLSYSEWSAWKRELFAAWQANAAMPTSQRGLYRLLTEPPHFSCQPEIAKVLERYF